MIVYIDALEYKDSKYVIRIGDFLIEHKMHFLDHFWCQNDLWRYTIVFLVKNTTSLTGHNKSETNYSLRKNKK